MPGRDGEAFVGGARLRRQPRGLVQVAAVRPGALRAGRAPSRPAVRAAARSPRAGRSSRARGSSRTPSRSRRCRAPRRPAGPSTGSRTPARTAPVGRPPAIRSSVARTSGRGPPRQQHPGCEAEPAGRRRHGEAQRDDRGDLQHHADLHDPVRAALVREPARVPAGQERADGERQDRQADLQRVVPCTPSRNSGRTNSSPSSPTLIRAEARLPRRKFGMRNSSRSSITGRPAAARDRSTTTSAAISRTPSARTTGTGDSAVSGQSKFTTVNGRVGVHQP